MRQFNPLTCLIQSPPVPVIRLTREAKSFIHTVPLGFQMLGCSQYRTWRHWISTYHRLVGTHDSGLLLSDTFSVIAQPILVIQVNAGNNSDIGINDIHGIKTATQAYFKDNDIHLPLAKYLQSSKRAEFKISQADGFAGEKNLFKCCTNFRLCREVIVNGDTFAVVKQMGRCINTNAQAAASQQGGSSCDARAFAISAADDNDPRWETQQLQSLSHAANPLQSQVDFLGMAGFQPPQPFIQR